MIRIYRIVILAVTMATLVPCLHEGPFAFELFPRPETEYSVKRGDTLYGIAGMYYQNPALWPFLWNQNPAVHIGDRVRQPGQAELTPGTKIDIYQRMFPFSVTNMDYMRPTGVPEEVRYFVSKIPFRGIPYDKKYFKHKLSRSPSRMWGYIVSSPEENKEHFLERDLVYVRFRPSKKQCVLVGDRFGIYRERGPVYHPENEDRPIGYVAEVVGEVEIINTGHELCSAIILDSYVEIVRGDKICLFTPRRREIVPTKTHRLLTGTILHSASREAFYKDIHHLENDIVFIDRGEKDGMKEGMLLNIYRASHPVADPYSMRYLSAPDKIIGEGMILKAFDKNSTVLITRSREEVIPGDIVKSVSD